MADFLPEGVYVNGDVIAEMLMALDAIGQYVVT
jgi:hypothetical protein